MNLSEERIIHNNGMNYEHFLTRAFKNDKRIRRANKSEYINLVNSENGKKISIQPNFAKQLEEVKNRLIKAINIFIENNKNEEQINRLKKLQLEVNQIKTCEDITKIINNGLEITK